MLDQSAGSGNGEVVFFDDQTQEIPARCGSILTGQALQVDTLDFRQLQQVVVAGGNALDLRAWVDDQDAPDFGAR